MSIFLSRVETRDRPQKVVLSDFGETKIDISPKSLVGKSHGTQKFIGDTTIRFYVE